MQLQNPLNGQSNFDICNELYGTFDNFIKLLNDNNIANSSQIKNGLYFYDDSLKNINTNYIGFKYSTNGQ